MRTLPAMVDMSVTPSEGIDYGAGPVDMKPSDKPRYPFGLCISLCEDELEKLNLDDEDVQPGDMIHFMAMATVTSVSKNATQDGGQHCRLELQITHMTAEDEDTEEEAEPEEDKGLLRKLYF